MPGPPKRCATICPASQSCTPSSSNDLAYDCVQLVVSDPIYQLIIILVIIVIIVIIIIIIVVIVIIIVITNLYLNQLY